MAARASLEDIGSRISVLMSRPPAFLAQKFCLPHLGHTGSDSSARITNVYASSIAAKPSLDRPLTPERGEELSSEGTGVLDDVGIIQQLNTAGGRAPATGCGPTNVNTLGRVAYSADHYFYVSSDHADGSAAN